MILLEYYCPHCHTTEPEWVPECKINKDHSICLECYGRTELVPIKNGIITADKLVELEDNSYEGYGIRGEYV